MNTDMFNTRWVIRFSGLEQNMSTITNGFHLLTSYGVEHAKPDTIWNNKSCRRSGRDISKRTSLVWTELSIETCESRQRTV